MYIHHRIGPNTGISYSLGGGIFFWLLVLLGAFPFIAIAALIVVSAWLVAISLGLLLAIVGVIWHLATGRDARIPVPGSAHGTPIEYWMEEKGWIRLPNRLHLPTTSTQSTSRN